MSFFVIPAQLNERASFKASRSKSLLVKAIVVGVPKVPEVVV